MSTGISTDTWTVLWIPGRLRLRAGIRQDEDGQARRDSSTIIPYSWSAELGPSSMAGLASSTPRNSSAAASGATTLM
jgi:hypothetical protein